jgi:hypothetical protein
LIKSIKEKSFFRGAKNAIEALSIVLAGRNRQKKGNPVNIALSCTSASLNRSNSHIDVKKQTVFIKLAVERDSNCFSLGFKLRVPFAHFFFLEISPNSNQKAGLSK